MASLMKNVSQPEEEKEVYEKGASSIAQELANIFPFHCQCISHPYSDKAIDTGQVFGNRRASNLGSRMEIFVLGRGHSDPAIFEGVVAA